MGLLKLKEKNYVPSSTDQYTTKSLILESGGIELLVQLLTDPDPLVQQHTLETVEMLAVDYECRIALNDASVRCYIGTRALRRLQIVCLEYSSYFSDCLQVCDFNYNSTMFAFKKTNPLNLCLTYI